MPVAWAWLWLKARREPEWRIGLGARRGYAPPNLHNALWVHAASVGEVNSALALVRSLREQWPEVPLLLTAFTGTGCQRWLAEFGDDKLCVVSALPLDHPRWVRRWVSSLRPRAFLSVETEIWPNLFLRLHANNIPVLIFSARISASSVRGWTRWLGAALLEKVLAPVAHVGAQTSVDAERFESLGAAHVRVDGSLKWDAGQSMQKSEQGAVLRQALGHRRCWLAASTHDGEEAIILEAHQRLTKANPGLCLMLAPRHPRRAGVVAALCAERGLRIARRSAGDAPDDVDVWLIDTLGELPAFMTVAEWVFMGGSLVPVGGHNLLEPAMLSVPIMTGPYTQNAQEVALSLEVAGGLQRVAGMDEIVVAAQSWLDCPEKAQLVAQRAQAVARQGRGGLAKALKSVRPYLERRHPET